MIEETREASIQRAASSSGRSGGAVKTGLLITS